MIDYYVRDVRFALKYRCWFAALSLALVLPDICGMAEFPDAPVGERYIGWYDRYVGDYHSRDVMDDKTPYPSGEVVYSLRNTFLHQGMPAVVSEKVKESRNRVDRFCLMLGDSTYIHTMATTMETCDVALRTLLVDVTWLCGVLCDSAEAYYNCHREAFHFEFNIIPQSALFGATRSLDDFVGKGDPIGEILQSKLDSAGQNLRICDNVTERLMNSLSRDDWTVAEVQIPSDAVAQKTGPSRKTAPMRAEDQLREHRLRCLFGQRFREERFVRNREAILKAVLSAQTKVQLNDNLTKLFPGEDVKRILSRIRPETRDLPGR